MIHSVTFRWLEMVVDGEVRKKALTLKTRNQLLKFLRLKTNNPGLWIVSLSFNLSTPSAFPLLVWVTAITDLIEFMRLIGSIRPKASGSDQERKHEWSRERVCSPNSTVWSGGTIETKRTNVQIFGTMQKRISERTDSCQARESSNFKRKLNDGSIAWEPDLCADDEEQVTSTIKRWYKCHRCWKWCQ